MLIKQIEGFTRSFGAPPDLTPEGVCLGLPVRDVMTEEGNFMVSAWEPTPEELQALLRGETIKLWIRGLTHPVVSLTVGDL